MTHPQIISLNTQALAYSSRNQTFYQASDLGITVGFERTIKASQTINATSDELMIVLGGEAKLMTSADSESSQGSVNQQNANVEMINAGDALVIPQGLSYQLMPSENFCKVFIKFQPLNNKNGITERAQQQNTVLRIHDIDDKKHTLKVNLTGESFKMKTNKPVNKGQHLYQSPCGCFISGVWQSQVLATTQQPFPRNEFIYIHSGSLECIDDNNKIHTFTQGDVLFIPQGTVCHWRIKAAVCTYYAVIQNNN